MRWAESTKRRNSRGIYENFHSDPSKRVILNNDNDEKRRLFENCRLQAKRVVNPIIDWSDRDVWEYIEDQNIPVNPLYKCGWSRVGCIGCPVAGKHRYEEFSRYPKFRQMYVNAFERMLQERHRRGKMKGTWNMGSTGEDVFHWWMEDGVIPGQVSLFDEDDD